MKKIILNTLLFIALTSCQKEEISIGSQASDEFFLYNRGASMPVSVYGNTASNTFMLMVHGGPGGEDIVYRVDYVREQVESKVAVVYWDQRNSGGSQGGANGAHDSVEDFVDDFEKVIALLKHRYGKDISIFVNGHSWGGYLTPAFLQTEDNQYSVKGWIQTAGAHNITLLNEYSIEMQIAKAEEEIKAGNDAAEWTEIRDFCQKLNPPLSLDESLQLNRYAGKAEGLTQEIVKSPYTLKDFARIYTDNNVSVLHNTLQGIYNPVTRSITEQIFGEGGANVSANMNKITIPTLLLYGKYDYICPAKLGDDIENRIGSAYKKRVLFEKSGHSIMLNEEKAYWDEVIQFINTFK